MSPRTQEQLNIVKADRREAILNAALSVFAEDTYHAASVSKIAKKAGVSKGLMYNYFKGKEDLLFTLVNNIADKFMQRFEIENHALLNDKDIEQFVHLSFEVVNDDLELSKLFFSVYTQHDVMAIVGEKMLEKVQPFFMLLVDYFRSKGHEDPMATARYFSSTIDGIQMTILMDNTFPLASVKKMIIKQFTT
jgi:AcrR family transcriptional regulator